MAQDIYTISQYLRGKVDFTIPDEALRAIYHDRNVEVDTDVNTLDQRTKDLCLADLLMWVAGTSSVTSGSYDSDGGWQHQESNKTVTDRKSLRQWAMIIYTKYDDEAAHRKKNMVMYGIYGR